MYSILKLMQFQIYDIHQSLCLKITWLADTTGCSCTTKLCPGNACDKFIYYKKIIYNCNSLPPLNHKRLWHCYCFSGTQIMDRGVNVLNHIPLRMLWASKTNLQIFKQKRQHKSGAKLLCSYRRYTLFTSYWRVFCTTLNLIHVL